MILPTDSESGLSFFDKVFDKTLGHEKLDPFFNLINKATNVIIGFIIIIFGFFLSPIIVQLLVNLFHDGESFSETGSLIKYGLWGAGIMYMIMAGKRRRDFYD